MGNGSGDRRRAGALVGLAAVIATHNHPAVLYPETALTFRVVAPATVSTANAPQAFRYAGSEDFQPQQPALRAQPRPYPGAAYAPGYVYPPANYYGPGYYPGYYAPYYWGPSFGVVIGRGFGRGFGRRW